MTDNIIIYQKALNEITISCRKLTEFIVLFSRGCNEITSYRHKVYAQIVHDFVVHFKLGLLYVCYTFTLE